MDIKEKNVVIGERTISDGAAPATLSVSEAPPANAPVVDVGERMTHYEPPLGMQCGRIKTSAEKVFDSAVYGGIGWAGNATLSTTLAYIIKYTSFGKPKFDRVVNYVANLLNKEKPNVAAVAKNAEVVSLIIGGTLLMYPVTVMEHNKGKVVRWIDRIMTKASGLVGIKETEDTRVEKEAAFQLLDQEPKQGWKTILRARAVGIGAVFATLNAVGTPRNNWIEGKSAEFVTNTIKEKFPNRSINLDTVEKITRLATLDVLYSMVAAGGLYIDSHWINPPKRNRKIQEGTLSPINPPNEEINWVSQARKKTEKPEVNFQEMVKARNQEILSQDSQLLK